MRRSALLALVFIAAGCGGGGNGSSEPMAMDSAAVGERLEHRVVVPEDAGSKPPLLVLLHGRGGSPEDMASDELVDALADAGDRAPIVLLPDGGESSYWHDRRDGAWPRMVLREAIPAAVKRFGADGRRVAIGGISMGGFGALDIAASGARRFCAVGAHSPAIFPDAASTAEGAFDDAEDFELHDLLDRAAEIPAGAWVDVGAEDPFAPAVRELVGRMRRPRFHPWPGGHEGEYWRAHMDEYVQFYARELARCGRG
ncbi:MAG TPA: alpha/beta hydrolase-fold protein [Solirubrobacteraceae bacterium]|nr:alpha/beta hydrolase-fold protein [Solirubrobacteraceae bacterium]